MCADQRPHADVRGQAVTQPNLPGPGNEAGDEGIMQAVMNKKTVWRHADLSAIGELGWNGQIEGFFKVRVLVDDQRGIAAKLHRHLFHCRGGIAYHLLANAGRAGQRDLSHPFIGHDRNIGVVGGADDEVYRAIGKPGGPQAIVHDHGHARRLLGWPQHDGAARSQGRRQLARGKGRRKVPGGEGGNHADRLAADLETAARHPAFHDTAVYPARFLRVPAKLVAGEHPFAAGLRDGLASFRGDHVGGFISAAQHFVGRPVQSIGATEAPHRMQSGQGSGGGIQRSGRIGGACGGRFGQWFAGNR